MNQKIRLFLIPFALFLISFTILSFNLENQGISIDEWFHHTFAMVYFDSMMNGDLHNPCLSGIGTCEMINLDCAGDIYWVASGGLVKGLLQGFGDYLLSDSERVYYANTDPCRPLHHNQGIPGVNIPTQSELAGARLFSSVLGSLSVVLAYFIGTKIFSRFVGLSFGFVLLFHSLWMLHSRIITSEVYVYFFMLLSICLLVYSINSKFSISFKYLFFSGIAFGLAINTKLIIMEILPFLLFLIFFRMEFKNNFNLEQFKNKKFFLTSLKFISIFLIVSFMTVLLTNPLYYEKPFEKIDLQFDAVQNYGAANEPWSPNKKIYLQFAGTFSATILPIIDSYYYIFDYDNMPDSAKIGHTFTSISLSIMFIIGSAYIFIKIKKRQLSFGELTLMIWFGSIFVLVSLTSESYNSTRFLFPVIFPIILIMSYGLEKFLKNFSLSTKILFFIITICSHAITYLIFWKDIYFNPEKLWNLPVDINFKESLLELPVQIFGVIFIITLIYLFIRKKTLSFQSN